MASTEITTPGGLLFQQSVSRAVTLSDPDDPLSLLSQTDTLVLNGRTATSSFDAGTRTFTNTSAAGRQTVTTVDAQGRVVQTQVSGLAPISLTYDARGRLASIVQGSGAPARTMTFSYDPNGYLAGILDALNRSLGFQYDAAGRITLQTLPDGRQIVYAYDGNGNLTALTPPGRPVHQFNYTPVNLESEYAPPQPQPPIPDPRTLYSYNLDRQLDLITRPDGLTVDFVYDSAGRLSAQQLPPGQGQVSYAYDPLTGSPTAITGPNGETLTLSSDGSLLLSETWSGAVSGTVSRTYDTDFRVATQSVNGAQGVSFGYDPDSLLTGAGAIVVARNVQNGLVTGTTLGGVTDSYGYNGFGEVTSYAADANGSPLYGVQYSRDTLGRITEKTETISGVTTTFAYSYDAAGRLTDVQTAGSPTAHYDYDANSNRVGGYNLACGSITATHDDQDRLLTIDCGLSTASYTHTANGEWLTKTDSSGTTTYSYDVLGNLRAVTLPAGTLIEYVIDGGNRRVGKRVNGTLVQGWLYEDQLRPVAELDGGGNVVSRFVYGSKPNVPDYIVKGGVTYRLLSDHLGSPRLAVDAATGTAVQQMDYDEFGNVVLDTTPGFQPFGFAGGLYDRDTKLVRFGVRDYDSGAGRWTAKDPIRFQGGDTNLYGYVLNDPINKLDLTGKQLSGVTSGLRAVVWGLMGIRLVSQGGQCMPEPGSACDLAARTGSCILLPIPLLSGQLPNGTFTGVFLRICPGPSGCTPDFVTGPAESPVQ